MYNIIFAYLLFYTIPAILLDILQIRYVVCYSKKQPIILDKHDYLLAAEYTLIQRKISIVSHIYSLVIMVFWLQYGIAYLNEFCLFLTQNGFVLNWLIFMIFLGVTMLLHAPFSFIHKKIDKHFGFNKQDFKSLFIDSIKEVLLTFILAGSLVGLLLWIMEHVHLWWLVGFCVVFCVIILIQLIYPTIIAPMFNKFTPLQNKELETKIESLMQQVGFKSSGIYIMDASKRDGRLNAYFGGLGSSKRVVLFDTLLDKISEDGLIAILGHELGHFKHKDILFRIILTAITMFIVFAVMGVFFETFCSYIGLPLNHSNILILSLLFIPILTFLITPISNYFSRKAEYRADEFGASCVSKKALSEALVRLVNENKAFPHSHPAYIFFYYSHPPLVERLKALGDLHD